MSDFLEGRIEQLRKHYSGVDDKHLEKRIKMIRRIQRERWKSRRQLRARAWRVANGRGNSGVGSSE